MADIKFSCPHCQQHIQAEPGYAGYQINCPNCQGSLVVPGAPPPPPTPPPQPRAAISVSAPASSSAAGCPSCGNALARGAVLCTNCGYNLSTGKRTVAGRPAALGKPKAASGETPWYLTAWPYLGFMFVVLGVLYFLGRQNPVMILAFIAVALLFTVTVHIIVIVAAFRDGIATGFLTLCIPFYALYYVFKVSDNDTLKILYGFAVITNICLRVLPYSLK